MNTPIRVNLDEYTRRIGAAHRQFPFAASKSLNDLGFNIRKDLIDRAPKDMRFHRGHQAALGIGVVRSAKRDLEAVVKSERKWLMSQTQDGRHKPIRGIKHKGRKHLLTPPKGNRLGAKKFKQNVRRIFNSPRWVTFILEMKGGTLGMFARSTRNSEDIHLIGILVEQSNFGDEFGWIDESERTIDADFAKIFQRNLDRALRSAR